jgi:ferredoxin
MNNNYTEFLSQFAENDWLQTLERLAPEIHAVDRNAARIWFRFYPLELARLLQTAENKDELIQKFVLQGDYDLKNQIDSSHRFLYGHRFWSDIKAAIEQRAANFQGGSANLADEVKQIARTVSEKRKTDESLLVAIAGIGLMTLNQVGLDAFKIARGETEKPHGLMNNSPEKIVAERAKDDSQGIFSFLKTVDKKWTVRYESSASGDGKFQMMNDEEIASGAARDQSKNWRADDIRCGEGVIPVECRSAACGTCWIGILEGAEKLSDVSPRERKQMKVFGYRQGDAEKPLLRLACQARGYGAVSIVIPPWNGVFGKRVYGNVEEIELEPATTSAKKLRETISSATENN